MASESKKEPYVVYSRQDVAPLLEQIRNHPEDAPPLDFSHVKFSTAPLDPRFPNTNQTMACWQYYSDWHKCIAMSLEHTTEEESEKRCYYFKRLATHMCPFDWIQKFDDQIRDGRSVIPEARKPMYEVVEEE